MTIINEKAKKTFIKIQLIYANNYRFIVKSLKDDNSFHHHSIVKLFDYYQKTKNAFR